MRGGGGGGGGLQHGSLFVPGLRTLGGRLAVGAQTVKNVHSEGTRNYEQSNETTQ